MRVAQLCVKQLLNHMLLAQLCVKQLLNHMLLAQLCVKSLLIHSVRVAQLLIHPVRVAQLLIHMLQKHRRDRLIHNQVQSGQKNDVNRQTSAEFLFLKTE
jgi:hypothetical protein